MDRLEIGGLGIVIVLVLLALRVPVAIALGAVAFVGIWQIIGMSAAWGILTTVPYTFTANWNLSAIPMFLLMGFIASQAGLTRGLFSEFRVLFRKIPGGLASATVLSAAMFSTASGSSVATSAAFSRIAIPEMLRAGYKPSLATGVVASAGTLGSMIPPSVAMIIFGIITEASIAQLFIAGIIPGALTAAMYIAMITIRVWMNPALAPSAVIEGRAKSAVAIMKDVWPLPVLILGVLGGIFWGFFTPTEAGAIGASLAILIALTRGAFSWPVLTRAIADTAVGTSTLFLVAMAATMFAVFMGLAGVPSAVSRFATDYIDSPLLMIALLVVLYLILGMFIDSIGVMILTLPVLTPMFHAMDLNMIWIGIIVIKLLEIGLLTPPVGLNIYVVKSSMGSAVRLQDVFRGAGWFILTDMITLALLIFFPAIVLFLPEMMK